MKSNSRVVLVRFVFMVFAIRLLASLLVFLPPWISSSSLVGQNLMTNCFQWACFILDFRQAKQARIVPSTKLTPKEVTQKPNLAGIRLLLPLINVRKSFTSSHLKRRPNGINPHPIVERIQNQLDQAEWCAQVFHRCVFCLREAVFTIGTVELTLFTILPCVGDMWTKIFACTGGTASFE